MSMVDRDSQYMKSMWGTTKLITDYSIGVQSQPKIIQEIMYDPANKSKQAEDLYEYTEENSFEYGVEPTYKLNKGQKLL
jgi:hypothetical protein